MQAKFISVSVGSSNFVKTIRQGDYYIDKTRHIRSIFLDGADCTLITRPRRFGKTLMMNTLRTFLEMNYADPGDRSPQQKLFEGLAVREDKDFCEQHMGRYPVVTLSLKDVDGLTFTGATAMLLAVLQTEIQRHSYLLKSDKPKEQTAVLKRVLSLAASGVDPETLPLLKQALLALTIALHDYHGISPVVLIDEYDVPLQKARLHGFYDEMIDLIRGVLSSALKDNLKLRKAILTGCLRVVKGSIFTGLNNFATHGISDDSLAEAFGFTEEETAKVLRDFGLTQCADGVKAHYDGYRFGQSDIYCPWDLMRFCVDNRELKEPVFKPYWLNTSSNDLIEEFLRDADEAHLAILKKLIAGEPVTARVNEEISFAELNAEHTSEGLLSLLFMTGYLTKIAGSSDSGYELRIPNEEIRTCFKRRIETFFSRENLGYVTDARKLAQAMLNGDAVTVESCINESLARYMSIRDSGYEAFYHGYLIGLLSAASTSLRGGIAENLSSNTEMGSGYPDITFRNLMQGTGVILEIKKSAGADEEKLLAACDAALAQIKARKYYATMLRRNLKQVRLCGIAFSGKSCAVCIETVTAENKPASA